MKTREEHLNWCKQRALEYLDRSTVANAIASMLSDLNKHPETALEPDSILTQLGLMEAMNNSVSGARRFIEGFN